MTKISNKQMGFIFCGLILGAILIKAAVGSAPHAAPVTAPVQAEPKQSPTVSNEPSASTFAASVKTQLQKDLKSVDVHLSNEGSLRWLFIVVSYSQWKSFSKDSRRELIEHVLRQMKDNYPKSGLKISVGVNANQPLAEADWGLLSNEPEIRLIGE